VVAPQGNGKTTYATDETSTIALYNSEHGTQTNIFFVMRKGSDPAISAAMEALANMRMVEAESHKWDAGLSFLDSYIEGVKKYYELLTNAREKGIATDNIMEHLEGGNPSALLQMLHIPNFGPPVSTILILEDTGRQKCFTNEASAIVNYLRILRELRLTVFILVIAFKTSRQGSK
jgi:hypothetical protein